MRTVRSSDRCSTVNPSPRGVRNLQYRSVQGRYSLPMIARRTLLTRLGGTALGGAAACAGARTSTKGASNMAPTEDTRAAARRFYDVLTRALQSGDLSSLSEVIADDAVDHDPVPG